MQTWCNRRNYTVIVRTRIESWKRVRQRGEVSRGTRWGGLEGTHLRRRAGGDPAEMRVRESMGRVNREDRY